MSFLVTGGAGFIGSHVVRNLREFGPVTIYDSFQIYKYPIQPWFVENMHYRRMLIGDSSTVRGSTMDRARLREVIDITRPEVIVHLAALPIANLAQRSGKEAFDNIAVGTYTLLSLLQEMEFDGLLVYISSSMVYGSFTNDPIIEEDETRPIGVYGGAKLAGEELVKAYARANSFSYIIIRPSAVYGPGDNNQRVVQIFLQNALVQQPITVYTGSDMRLDFTYVEDTAMGITLAATSGKNAHNDTYNITRGQAHSLWELADIVKEQFPKVVIKKEKDPHNFRPKRGALDISKARHTLKYKPEVDLELGVLTYLNYMQQYNFSLKGPT